MVTSKNNVFFIESVRKPLHSNPPTYNCPSNYVLWKVQLLAMPEMKNLPPRLLDCLSTHFQSSLKQNIITGYK